MPFSKQTADERARRRKKTATRTPKIRWSIMGLANPEAPAVSIDEVRKGVAAMALQGFERPAPSDVEPARRGRNALSGVRRASRRGAADLGADDE